MHTAPLYRADFAGMRVRIIERQGNPCNQRELQEHFHARHRLVMLTTTQENIHIAPGHWFFRLATTKPSWNAPLRESFKEPSIMIVGINEVIVDVGYVMGLVHGTMADVVEIKMKSLEDGFEYIARIYIHHGTKPPFPMKHSITNAAP